LAGSRELPSPIVDNILRTGMEVSRSTIITQSLPKPQHFIKGSGSQVLDAGKPIDKAIEIRQPLSYPGLLKNDFRKPNDIWVFGISPRQITFVYQIPAQKGFCKNTAIQNF